MKRTSGIVGAVALLTTACGETNLNKIWGADDEGADTMFVEAQIAYDQGDFDKSEKITAKLLARNPMNEDAAILYGYTNLSKGGIDPYQLARKLIDLSESGQLGGTGTGGTTGGTGTGTGTGGASFDFDFQQTPTTPTTTTQTSDSSNASSTLLALSSLINLSEADFVALQNGDKFTGTSGLFASSPIVVPALVTDELRAKVPTLTYMDRALKAVCRLVDDSVKVSGDTRHADASCTKLDFTPENRAKAHFLWAFSHLTEALVYQSVLLYSSVSSGKSNFEVAADSLNNFKGTGEEGFNTFVGQVTDMKTALDKVFDTATPNSMIASTLRDMQAVTNAFAVLSGLPESITSRITSAMDKINELGKTFGGDSGNVSALKGQMTEKFSTVLSDKINTVITDKFTQIEQQTGLKPKSADDIAKIPDQFIKKEDKDKLVTSITNACSSYDSLTTGVDPTKLKARPTACPAKK